LEDSLLGLERDGADSRHADHERFHGENDAERAYSKFENVDHLSASKVLKSCDKQYDQERHSYVREDIAHLNTLKVERSGQFGSAGSGALCLGSLRRRCSPSRAEAGFM